MKKIIIIAAALVIFIGGFLVVKSLTVSKPENMEILPTPTVVLPTVSESVKVELTAKDGNKAVTLKVAGIPQDVDSVEYELTYTTAAGLPRGVLGKITTDGKSEIVRDDIVLGTCSSGKCVYDTGVTSVELSLKLNSSTGSSIFHKTYPL